MTTICKNCKHFNWKLSGTKNWGECLNPKVVMRISFRLVNLENISAIKTPAEYKKAQDEIANYARIQLEEDTFGCIHFDLDEHEKT